MFVFKRKIGRKWNVVRYKVHLVAHGNLQQYGIDYDKTYAPLVEWEVTLTVVSVMVSRGAYVYLVDFETSFLNGDLNEVVYITLPKAHDKNQKVYVLEKSIYGLKQSPKNWFIKLSNALKKHWFKVLSSAECVFTKGSGYNRIVLLIYVYNMFIMSESQAEVQKTKMYLMETFKSTDLGPLKYFLGINFDRTHNRRTMCATQKNYIERLLERFGMENAR